MTLCAPRPTQSGQEGTRERMMLIPDTVWFRGHPGMPLSPLVSRGPSRGGWVGMGGGGI